MTLSLCASQLGIRNQQESLCLAYCIYYYGAQSRGLALQFVRTPPSFQLPQVPSAVSHLFIYLCRHLLLSLLLLFFFFFPLHLVLFSCMGSLSYSLYSFYLFLREQAPIISHLHAGNGPVLRVYCVHWEDTDGTEIGFAYDARRHGGLIL